MAGEPLHDGGLTAPADGPALARDDRKRAGAWYTPPDLALRLVERAAALSAGPIRSVVDPFCGAGVFLRAAAAPGRMLHGVERDPEIAAACRAALPAARIATGDALLAPELGGVDWRRAFPEIHTGFDMVAGNPPWEVIERSVVSPSFGPEYAGKLRGSGYRFQRAVAGRGGKLNLYRLALERGFSLLRPGGVLAFLVPAGFLRDAGSAALRKHFLTEGELAEVWELASDARLFPTAHRDLPVCALFVRRGGPTRRVRLAGGWLAREALERFSPDLLAIPAITRAGEAELLARLQEWPRLTDCVAGIRKGDVNLATDRGLFRERPTALVLRTGKELLPYRVASQPVRWVDETALGVRRSRPWERPRVAWRDIADVTLKKRMCAAPVPAGTVLGDTIDFLVPGATPVEADYWLAVLNSHSFEWSVRLRSAHNHLGQLVVGACPVPPWIPGDPLCQEIASAGAAADVLRADVLVSRRYGLSRADLDLILEVFPKQPRTLKDALLAGLSR